MNDCYVMAPERSAQIALKFLDRFLPNRTPGFDPRDPGEVLGLTEEFNLKEVFEYLEIKQEVEYAMYFQNEAEAEIKNAGVFFQEDGSLFLMLSVDDLTGLADETLEEIQRAVNAVVGYWSFEEPPAADADSFRKRALKFPSSYHTHQRFS